MHSAEEIWQISRKRFIPQMPAPLEGLTELSMWQLACNTVCEFCGKKAVPGAASAPNDQWHSGPGNSGVRPVWAFQIRTCGPCLHNQVVKEIDLLLSSMIPSQLICALPFIFLTGDLHVVASTSLQQGQQPPSGIQISKHFLKQHVEGLKQEHSRVKTLGSPAADEWIRGLDSRGKAKRSDAARWERWETANGLMRMRSEKTSIMPDIIQPFAVRPPGHFPASLPPRPATYHGYSGFGQPPPFPPPAQGPVITHYPPPPSMFQNNLAQRMQSPLITGYGPYAPPAFNQPKPARTKEEADRLKAARRAEIERRCMELNPPITPNVLAHMSSFQAALHIIKPLDETAWEMLKPRLLSQRADAQKREEDRLRATLAVQEKQKERSDHIDQSQEGKDLADRDYEDIQVVVRNRIGAYADEIIRDGWLSGAKVDKENTARFAAEVLIYVRKRFYAEVAKDDAAARAAGNQQPADPQIELFSRKLTLENMRWVFETKIKPLTDKFRKELFLCNGCDNAKWYAFEGVCQHYASKHTTSLSSGSIVVHWRAEWPEEPPFNPEPHLAKPASAATAPVPELFPNGLPAPAPVVGIALAPSQSATTSTPVTSLPAPVLGQPIGQPPVQYPAPYASQSIPYAQQNVYQQFSQPTQISQYPMTPAVELQPYQNNPYPGNIAGPPNTQPALGQAAVPVQQVSSGILQVPNVASATDAHNNVSHPIYRTEAYKMQLQDLAATAKNLWNETAGVKEMQGSVRVHLILYHMLKRLRDTYTDDPPLSMFIDGIQNVKEMRIVRNVNGLACKICTRDNANKPINPHTVSAKASSAADRKLYSLPQLVNHYRSLHTTQDKEDSEWQTEMVELPDKKKIRALIDANGMDAHKVQLLREALPDAFRPDTPEQPPTATPVPDYPTYYENQETLAPSKDKHEQYYSMPVNTNESSNSPTDSLGRSYSRHLDTGEDVTHRPIPVSSNRLKRKADTPLDGRRQPVHEIQSHGSMIDYRAERPENRKRTQEDFHWQSNDAIGERAHYRMVRPEYDEESDLSRLLERTGNNNEVAPPHTRPVEQTYFVDARPRSVAQPSRAESRQSLGRLVPVNYARTAAERFLDEMDFEGGRSRNIAESGAMSQRAGGVPAVVTEAQVGAFREVYSDQAYDRGRQSVVQRNIQYVDERGQPVPPPRQYSPMQVADATRQIQHSIPAYENGRSVQYEYHGQQGRHSPPRRDVQYIGAASVLGEDTRTARAVRPQNIRYVDGAEVKYEEERARPRSPIFVSEQLHARPQQRPGSGGAQNIAQDPVYSNRQTRRLADEGYDQAPSPIYYQDYVDEAQPKPRQVAYQPEVEYVRMRDAEGEYLVERPVRREPVYARYDEAPMTRQPAYDEGRTRRPVYIDEIAPAPVRYVNAPSEMRPVYTDNPRASGPIYAGTSMASQTRYGDVSAPVPARMEMDPRAIGGNQDVMRSRPVVGYDEDQMRSVRYETQGRHPLRERTAQISRNDPAYLEEYDPHNPTPLPGMPRGASKFDR